MRSVCSWLETTLKGKYAIIYVYNHTVNVPIQVQSLLVISMLKRYSKNSYCTLLSNCNFTERYGAHSMLRPNLKRYIVYGYAHSVQRYALQFSVFGILECSKFKSVFKVYKNILHTCVRWSSGMSPKRFISIVQLMSRVLRHSQIWKFVAYPLIQWYWYRVKACLVIRNKKGFR